MLSQAPPHFFSLPEDDMHMHRMHGNEPAEGTDLSECLLCSEVSEHIVYPRQLRFNGTAVKPVYCPSCRRAWDEEHKKEIVGWTPPTFES